MTIDDEIKVKKLQYGINRETAKVSALSSCKIDKYEYLTSKKKLPSDQIRIIEQAKLTYSWLGKTFEKQKTIIENQLKTIWSIRSFKTYYSKVNNYNLKRNFIKYINWRSLK